MIIKLRVLTKAPTYARTIAKPCKQGRMHYPQSPPAEYALLFTAPA